MWILSGPFDGNEGDIYFEKQKLLKPGKKYVLGRKDRELVVNNKKVSREHATFILGEYGPDGVTDPSTRPSVHLHNQRNVPLIFTRDGESLQIGASSTIELQNGDIVRPFTNSSIKLEWCPLCCYSSNMMTGVLDGCAGLGINLVHTFHPDVTHHITANFSLTPSIMLSLISGSQFVTQMWLEQVLRLGQGSGIAPLELEFQLPQTSKFQPQYAPSLPPSLQRTCLWEPTEERRKVFAGYRFILLTYKSEKVEPLLEFFSRTGASSTVFGVDDDRSNFIRILSKNKTEKSLVVVADETVKETVGIKQWNELQHEVQNFGRHFIYREQVLEAAIKVDSSILSAGAVNEQVDLALFPLLLPDFASNTLPEEPSSPLNQVRSTGDRFKPGKLAKHTAPSTPSVVSVEEGESPPLPSRPLLTRRAGTAMGASVLGINDSVTFDTDLSIPVDDELMPPPPPNKTILGVDFDAPVVPRSSRLKRRAGTAGLNTLTQTPDYLDSSGVEPPLKKFKALFEESDPDRMSQVALSTFTETDTQSSPAEFQSLPPSETQIQTGRPVPSRLHVIEEEEENTMSAQAGFSTRGVKRKPDLLEENDNYDMIPGAGRKAKRRIVKDLAGNPQLPIPSKQFSMIPASQTQSQKASGFNFGQPDVDITFLKAIASMKKGRKNEDSFDREFNNLRISKPDLQGDDREKEWSVLEDFGDERNVRGNFMVVVEIEVFKKGNDLSTIKRGTGRADWEGKPDFKKFRKASTMKLNPSERNIILLLQKHLFEQRPIIELTISEENDYGMGSAYWNRTAQSPSQPPDETVVRCNQSFSPKSQQSGSKYKGLTVPMKDSDEDEFPVIPPGKRATQSQKDPHLKVKTKHPKEEEFQPLFLDSDDERMVYNDKEVNQLEEEIPTLRSSRSSKTQKSQPAVKKRTNISAAIIIDDDSDDGTTFKGFGAKKKGRSQR